MTTNIIHTDTFVETVTDLIARRIFTGLENQGYFILGLSGGSTPKPIYEALARTELPIDWDKVIFTFGDERTVPPDHNDSNYKTANDRLFSKIATKDSNILRMKGEIDPATAAIEYEKQMLEIVSKLGMKSFRHDLLLLGVGDDGHTASLFPNTDALNAVDRLCIENHVPQLDTNRITLTFDVINDSKEVMFLLNGPAKAGIAQEVIEGSMDHPASRVKPTNGIVTWALGWLPSSIE